MTRIFLTGFMGAGKTTLGKALAKARGLSFIDLDQYIEGRYMKSVSQLFAQLGEDGFRQIENRLLREAGQFEDVVIATGGSTPLAEGNMDFMLANGQTLYLQCEKSTLLRRLRIAKGKRPLIADKSDTELEAFIESETARREPYYLKSEFICPGDRLETRDQIDETIKYVIGLLNL